MPHDPVGNAPAKDRPASCGRYPDGTRRAGQGGQDRQVNGWLGTRRAGASRSRSHRPVWLGSGLQVGLGRGARLRADARKADGRRKLLSLCDILLAVVCSPHHVDHPAIAVSTDTDTATGREPARIGILQLTGQRRSPVADQHGHGISCRAGPEDHIARQGRC